MRTQRLNAARSIAARLFAAEKAIDEAVARIAELNATLPMARLDANLAVCVGQSALASSAKAMVMAAKTRSHIVATHARLKQASDDIGLGAVGFGDELKAPKATDLRPVTGELSIAA